VPTYEYTCKSCGEHLEVVQSFKDSALTECPACGGPLRKVFGNIGIAFKGSGFYKTDNRSDGHKAGSRSADIKSSDGKSSEAKSGDAKSAETAGKATTAPPRTKPEASKPEASKPGGPKSRGAGAGARVAAAS
jgi:putative FmdB family regulatory protein